MTRLRCAILDDYMNLTPRSGGLVEDRRPRRCHGLQPALCLDGGRGRGAADFEIICAMRERTPFPRALFAALPKLKLLITSGMRNAAIDMEAAKDHQVVLCGTQWGRDPTAPLTMGLILELTRNIGRENARMHAGEPLQKFVGIEIEGKTLGVVGLGKLGAKVSGLAKAFGMNVIAWSPNLTRGTLQGSRRRLRHQGGIVLDRRHRHRPCGAEPAFARPCRRRRPGADEADRFSRQHRARADRRRGGAVGNPEGAQHRRRRGRRVLGRAASGRSPFRKLDNIVLTPHLGYVTEESFRNHYGQMVEGIDAWFKGETLRRLA